MFISKKALADRGMALHETETGFSLSLSGDVFQIPPVVQDWLRGHDLSDTAMDLVYGDLHAAMTRAMFVDCIK